MSVDLKKIKELRERTNSGFLDCKNALEESENDIEKAILWLQEKGIVKAAKKAGRIAADGIVRSIVKDNVAVLFELNAETDFVARNEMFLELANRIGKALVESDFSNEEELKNVKVEGLSIEEQCNNLTAKIGEKISFRRANKYVAAEGEVVAEYTHANNRIAVILLAKGSNTENLRNVAMHVAALNPSYMCESCLDEKELAELQEKVNSDPKLANKPEKIQAMIKEGLLKKEFVEKGVLKFQPFVMEESLTVGQYLQQSGLELKCMKRYEVGEGIEKKVVDFAAEVAEQMTNK